MMRVRILKAIGVQTDTVGLFDVINLLARHVGIGGGIVRKRSAKDVAVEYAHKYRCHNADSPHRTLEDYIEAAILETEKPYIQLLREHQEALDRERSRYSDLSEATSNTYSMLIKLSECALKEKNRAQESEEESNMLRCLVRELYREMKWNGDPQLDGLHVRTLTAAEGSLRFESRGCDD